MAGINLGALTATLVANTANFDKGMTRAQETMANFGKSTSSTLSSTAQKFRTFGYLATAAVTVPIVAAGKAIFNMAKDYEFSIQKIVGLAGVAQDAVNKWNKTVLEMSPEVAKGPKELAEGLYYIASSGVKGAEALNILKLSARAASAGLGETQQVANLLTSVMNAYAGTGITSAHATDVLVAAVREGKAEASSFAGTLGQIIPIAAELGVKFDDVAGGMAAITLTGSSTAQAATYLKGVFNSLLKATMHGEKALGSMGSSYAELRKILREGGVIALMQKIRDMSVEYGETLSSEVFPNIRALTGFLSIAGKNFKYNSELMDRVANSTGAMDTAWNAVANTIQIKWNKAIAEVNVSMVTLGQTLAGILIPLIEGFARVLSNITKWFNGLSEAGKRFYTIAIMLIAALGPVNLLLSLFLYTINGLKLAFAGIAANVVGVIKVFGLWVSGLFDVAKASEVAKGAIKTLAIATSDLKAAEEALIVAKEKVVAANVVAASSNYTNRDAVVAVKIAEEEQIVAEQAVAASKAKVVTATNASSVASARAVAVTGRVNTLNKVSLAINTALAWTYGKIRTGVLLALGAENLAVTAMKAKKAVIAATIPLNIAQEKLLKLTASATSANTIAMMAENDMKAKAIILQQAYMAKLANGKATKQSILTIQKTEIAYNEAYVLSQRTRIAADIMALKANIATKRVKEASITVLGLETVALTTSTAIQNGATVGKIGWIAALKASTVWLWLSTLGIKASTLATGIWTAVTTFASGAALKFTNAIKATTAWTWLSTKASKAATAATVIWTTVTTALGKAMKSAFMLTAIPIATAGALIAGIAAAVVGLVLLVSHIAKTTKAKKELAEIEKQHFEASQETSAQIGRESAELEILVATLKSNNLPMAVRAKLVQEFNDKYGQYLGYLIDERTGIEELTRAYQTLIPLIESRLNLEGAISYAGTAAAEKAKTLAEIEGLRGELSKLKEVETSFVKKNPQFASTLKRLPLQSPTTTTGSQISIRPLEDTKRYNRIAEIQEKLLILVPKLATQEENLQGALVVVKNASEESNKKTEEANRLAEEKAILDKKVAEGISNMTVEEKKAFDVKEKVINQLQDDIKAKNAFIESKEKALKGLFPEGILYNSENTNDYDYWRKENAAIEEAKKIAATKDNELQVLLAERKAITDREYAEKQVATRERLVKELSAVDLAAYDKGLTDLKKFEEDKKVLTKQKEESDKAIEAFKSGEFTNPEENTKAKGEELVRKAAIIQGKLDVVNEGIRTSTITTTRLSGEALKTNYEEVLGYLDRLEQEIKDKNEELGKLSTADFYGAKGTKLKGEIVSKEYELKQAKRDSRDLIEEQIKRNETLQLEEETAIKKQQLNSEKEEAKLFDIKIKYFDKETEAHKKTILGEQELTDYANDRKAKREEIVTNETNKRIQETTNSIVEELKARAEIQGKINEKAIEGTLKDKVEEGRLLEEIAINTAQKLIDIDRDVLGKDVTIPQAELDLRKTFNTPEFLAQSLVRKRAMMEESVTYKGVMDDIAIQLKNGEIDKKKAISEERRAYVEYFDFSKGLHSDHLKFLQGLTREELNYTISRLDTEVQTKKRAYEEDTANFVKEEEYRKAVADLAAARVTKATDDASKSWAEFQSSVKNSVDSFAASIAVSLGEGIGNALSGQDFGFDTILEKVGEFVKQMGELFIAYGVAALAFQEALSTPATAAAAIIAGIALVAIGAAITKAASAGVNGVTENVQIKPYGGLPSYAEGGFVKQPTLAVVGDAKDGKGEWVLNSKQMENLTATSESDSTPIKKNIGVLADATFATSIPSFLAPLKVNKLLQSLLPMADGGLLTGPQLVLAGEYAGARKNPEAFMPLNKLQSLLDNRGGGGVLTAVVSGKDLRFVLNQEDKFLHRT